MKLFFSGLTDSRIFFILIAMTSRSPKYQIALRHTYGVAQFILVGNIMI